jgi:hypothetical protein
VSVCLESYSKIFISKVDTTVVKINNRNLVKMLDVMNYRNSIISCQQLVCFEC